MMFQFPFGHAKPALVLFDAARVSDINRQVQYSKRKGSRIKDSMSFYRPSIQGILRKSDLMKRSRAVIYIQHSSSGPSLGRKENLLKSEDSLEMLT